MYVGTGTGEASQREYGASPKAVLGAGHVLNNVNGDDDTCVGMWTHGVSIVTQ